MNLRNPLLTALVAVCLTSSAARGEEIVELVPEDAADLSATTIFAPFLSLVFGPGYWYKAREIRIETVPPGAALDLFYIRASFQKAYEQAEAPVTVRLPSRVAAGKRDLVTIRALLDGYQQQEVRVPVRSRQTEVVIELAPVANSLQAVAHRYVAGRGTLDFLTRQAVTFRVQKSDEGFALVLNGTSLDPGAARTLDGVASPLIARVRPQQLGEDLVVRVDVAPAAGGGDAEVRSRQSHDPVRNVHRFSLDFVPADGGAESVQRALAALARIAPADVRGCALRYDAVLRERLDPTQLARALVADGSFTDPYLREAMKRLGQLSGGVITLTDGSTFRSDAPIELMAAASRSPEAIGYLAILRAFVAQLEPEASRRAALRALVAPELPIAEFAEIADAAEAEERACRSG